MKYRLTNLTITKATNSRGEYKWMRVGLKDESNFFAAAASSRLPTMTIFNEDVVDAFMPYAVADPTRPGTFKVNEPSLEQAIKEGKIPDILHWGNIFAVTMPLPQPYARIYRADVKNQQTGAIEHKKGDFVIPEGQTSPTIVTSLTINVPMVVDNETGERSYPPNGAPDQILRNILEVSYRPVPVQTASITDAPAPPVVETDESDAESVATISGV